MSDWRARFVSDVTPVVMGIGYGYGDTAIRSQARYGVVSGLIGRRVCGESACDRGVWLDLDGAVGGGQVALAALELAGHAAGGRIGRHSLHEVHKPFDEGFVDALRWYVDLGAVCVDHGARKARAAPRRARGSGQHVHVDLHLQDVGCGLPAGLGVVDNGGAVGVARYQVGPAAHGET